MIDTKPLTLDYLAFRTEGDRGAERTTLLPVVLVQGRQWVPLDRLAQLILCDVNELLEVTRAGWPDQCELKPLYLRSESFASVCVSRSDLGHLLSAFHDNSDQARSLAFYALDAAIRSGELMHDHLRSELELMAAEAVTEDLRRYLAELQAQQPN